MQFEINFTYGEISEELLDSELWRRSDEIDIATYWSGEEAPPRRPRFPTHLC